jgi:hypothetical protein
MAVDLESVFTRGGKDLLDLLQFSVCSMQLEPLFVVLAREYRQAATAARALALYDVFCSPAAPARIRAAAVLEPFDLRLARAISALRRQVEQSRQPPSAEEGNPTPRPIPLPPPYLFAHVVEHLQQEEGGILQLIARDYDPAKSPVENLPGGRLSPGQRFFVDKVWHPRLRPALVAAGFWRVAAVGG